MLGRFVALLTPVFVVAGAHLDHGWRQRTSGGRGQGAAQGKAEVKVAFNIRAFMGVPMNSHPRDGHPFAEVASRPIGES
jgi:hypothetical protein